MRRAVLPSMVARLGNYIPLPFDTNQREEADAIFSSEVGGVGLDNIALLFGERKVCVVSTERVTSGRRRIISL